MKHSDKRIEEELVQSFQTNYCLKAVSFQFIPVGEESYAYKITTDENSEYFVKYCEKPNIIKNIDQINQLLLDLAHLSFVIPPVQVQGKTSFELLRGKMYAYPFVVGEVLDMENHKFDKELVNDLTMIMASIHNTNPKTDLVKETFENNFSKRHEDLILAAKRGELVNGSDQLLFDNEKIIRDLINSQNKIGERFTNNKPTFVLTHGDITGLNIIRTSDGIKLVDWDEAMYAPLERDINFLHDNPSFSVDHYLSLVRHSSFDPELKEYYGRNWSLESIVGNFEGIRDNSSAKNDLNDYLAEINEYLNYYK